MPLSTNLCPRRYDARRLWLAQTHITLDAFDRLTAKGLSDKKAARQVGVNRATIRQMRRSTASLEDVFQRWQRVRR